MVPLKVGRLMVSAVVERLLRSEGGANRDVLVLGTHFHAPTAGHVVREGAAWHVRV